MIATQTIAPPSLSQLGKAIAFAFATAGVILIAAVLPAEYGIDPTGVGHALGLTELNSGARKQDTPVLPAAGTAATLVKSETPMRSDALTLTLQPGEGAEVKAAIKKGEGFVFSWSTDGAAVKSDMHGEPLHAKANEFTTYWKTPQQTSGQGTFIAPFDGIHGWFWRNKGKAPVTIKVSVTGFQEKLYRPAAQ